MKLLSFRFENAIFFLLSLDTVCISRYMGVLSQRQPYLSLKMFVVNSLAAFESLKLCHRSSCSSHSVGNV